ncbi:winged helix-turn-helix transcriptional regulator [Methanomicrobium antiquum]|uniref:Winged helix-turn-helix transcriptional regulator n=1 Tax=Methanomicrobium antiquum TaxID=487686 RepID=A0AAF0FR10_9EURY|nr:winged helix-turn-helix transcriptional regulator [Methanomicrobium antiquum]WFN36406.1 winged helix-turn-helix transcriptional regulator [Methanomicrobium antiquum]
MDLKGVAIALILIFIFAYINQTSVSSNIVVTPSEDPVDFSREDVVTVSEWWEIPLNFYAVSYIAEKIPFLIPLANLIAVMAGFLFGIRFIKNKNVLDNEKRAEIFQIIQDNPGINKKGIENLTKINSNSLEYHLKMLESKDKITSQKESKKRHYFENHNKYSQENQLARMILDCSKTKEILNYISVNPGCTHKDLLEYTKMSGSTISWHTGKLRIGDLIDIKKDKNSSHHYIKPKAGFLLTESQNPYNTKDYFDDSVHNL